MTSRSLPPKVPSPRIDALPHGLQRQQRAHRMRQDIHARRAEIARDGPQVELEEVARIIGALAIIGIGEQLAARRPGEQDRHALEARIVNDLREAIGGIGEIGVEPVHEDENVSFRGRPLQDFSPDIGDDGRKVEPLHVRDGEMLGRIAGPRIRQFEVARLVDARHREIQARECQPRPPLAIEVDGLGRGLARRRDEHLHLAGDIPGDACSRVDLQHPAASRRRRAPAC